jgi:hypothetical protein
VLRYALRQLEAQHDFIDEVFMALHTPKVPRAKHLLLQQPLHLSEPTFFKMQKYTFCYPGRFTG